MDITSLNDVIRDIKIDKSTSISPDKESDERKTLNLTIDFDGVTLAQVLHGAVKSEVIRVQNNVRSKFDTLTDGQKMNVKFQAPAVQDIEQAFNNQFDAKSDEEKRAIIAKLEAKLNS